MRIEVVDPFEHGLGPALGLVELGHQVRYVDGAGCRSPRGDVGRMRRELVEQMLGGRHDEACGDADLTVVVGVFADQLDSMQRASAGDRVVVQWPGFAELVQPGGQRSYAVQLQRMAELLERCGEACVIDMSDVAGPREPLFEALPGVTLLARERAADERSPWQSFPYLFNSVVLWLERMTPAAGWLRAPERPRWDWVFCGTVDGARYGRRRRDAIQRLAQQHAQLAGAVFGDIGFAEVLAVIQAARFGLDLRGVGELCFRLHECLSVGTPLWRPWSGEVALPPGIAPLVFERPDQAPAIAPGEVRRIAAEHYSPVAAARWLLEKVRASGRYDCAGQTLPATNSAIAAST